MYKQQIKIQDKKEALGKFKEDYLRICKKLEVDAISSRQYDSLNNFMCRKVLSRELELCFNELVKAVGLKPLREFINPEMSKKLDKDILRLRLEEKSYLEISSYLDIDLSIQSVKRRLDKIYANAAPEVKLQLDAVKEKTRRGRYWQQLK